MAFKHQTKDGRQIKLKDLETNHLLNIIACHMKIANQGFVIQSGGGDDGDYWFDEIVLHGNSVFNHFKTQKYVAEFVKRYKKLKKERS